MNNENKGWEFTNQSNSSFSGAGINKGTVNIYNSSNKEDPIIEIKKILDDLSQIYPDASDSEKLTFLGMQIKKKDSTLKQSLKSAIESGGIELVKVLSDNPFISVSIETVKGWIEARSN